MTSSEAGYRAARHLVHVWLVHHPVLLRDGRIGHASVTPIDLSDFGRIATTYGLASVRIVGVSDTQKSLVARFLSHWKQGAGLPINRDRHRALLTVSESGSLDETCAALVAETGAVPRLVATSAVPHPGLSTRSFGEAASGIAPDGRALVLLFGTGQGLAPEVLDRCDFLLPPIEGGTDYNHLPVRAAAAIVLDRLFGRYHPFPSDRPPDTLPPLKE